MILRKRLNRSNNHCKNPKRKSTCKLKINISKAKPRSKNINQNQQKKFKCVKCNYAGARIQDLKAHEATHTGDRPFKCNKAGCNFTAAQRGNLKTHLRIHTGEKPYKCNQTGCNFRATQASHIRRHESVHNGGNKPFKCDQCKFQAREITHLRIHKMTHTGEKPYKCRGCPQSFTQADLARKHERGHMGLNLFACEFCRFKSPKWMNLKMHLALKHNNAGKEGPKNPRSTKPIRSQSKTASIATARPTTGTEEMMEISRSITENRSQSFCQSSNSIPVVSMDPQELLFVCDWCDFRCRSVDQCLEHSLKHRNE